MNLKDPSQMMLCILRSKVQVLPTAKEACSVKMNPSKDSFQLILFQKMLVQEVLDLQMKAERADDCPQTVPKDFCAKTGFFGIAQGHNGSRRGVRRQLDESIPEYVAATTISVRPLSSFCHLGYGIPKDEEEARMKLFMPFQAPLVTSDH